MKKETANIRRLSGLAMVLTLSLSAGMLSGCGGSKEKETTAAATTAAAKETSKAAAEEADEEFSILGAGDDDEDSISIYFQEDGRFFIGNSSVLYEGAYDWDGETAEISYEGNYLTATVDEDGNLDLGEDFQETFVHEDEVGYIYIPDNFSEDHYEAAAELVGTAWEMDGYEMHFLDDGVLIVPEYGTGSYLWNDVDGEITLDGEEPEEIILTEFGFFCHADDGEYLILEYVGAADESLLDGLSSDDYEDSEDSEDYGDSDDSYGSSDSSLTGEWYHNNNSNDYVTFTEDGEVYFSIDGGGGRDDYYYDGETVSFYKYTGYIDGDGDLVLDEVDGWFHYGYVDSSAESDGSIVGEWYNAITDDGLVFEDDGTVRYIIGDDSGVAEFEFDGEKVAFDGYNGHIDEHGALVIDGVEHWFDLDTE